MKKLLSLAVFVVLMSLAVGCGDNASPTEPKTSDVGGSFKVVEVDARPLLAPRGVEPALTAAATGANDFAFRLGAELAKGAGGRNFVFSPYSV